ncbi:MAG: cyclic nucleotide-binding domain-containing protein [candidate division NC10 bacterium]|nr:cyclic nucleotide-binding domain-containing protein [candidate division NC10 bacterium]
MARRKSRQPKPGGARPSSGRTAKAGPRADGAQRLVAALQSMPFFEGVPKASLTRIAGQMRRRRLSGGAVIFKQGDQAQEFCLLTAGRLEVTMQGGDPESPPIGIIEAPSWFGELAILTRQPRTATVTALTGCEVWTLSRDRFELLFARRPEMARHLIATLCDRIQQKDRDFLGQSALAIERARLLSDLQKRNEELAALAEVTRAVSASLDLDQTLHTISTHATQLTRSESASIFLYDDDRKTFEVRASYNTPEGYIAEVEGYQILGARLAAEVQPRSGTLVTRAAAERRPLQIPDIGVTTDYAGRDLLLRWGYRAILAVPLLLGERVIGAMNVRRRRAGEFSTREVELVTTFARQSAVAVENARLFREIQDTARQLEVVSRHKSQFLAGMSHELRTPLNAIIGFSEVLLDPSMGPLPAEEQQEFLTNILTSGKHLLRLINDVLDLSKIEAGKMELQPEAVSLPDTVEGVLGTVKPLAAKKQIRVLSDVAPDLPPLWADPPRLKQILYNLLSNAIKFTPTGGSVTVKARRVDWSSGQKVDPGRPIDSSTTRPRDRGSEFIEVAVADTGIGIPPEDLGRIFEEFEQVSDPTRPRQEGTGLGLALVRKLVEMHGGSIRVESTPGKGSTFTFKIPTGES